jgi:hypothetical protein
MVSRDPALLGRTLTLALVGSAGEMPADFNARVGQNLGAFQIAQQIPIVPYDYTTGAGGNADPLEWNIETSATDAAVFLTVYPSSLTIGANDLTNLGNQIKNCTSSARVSRRAGAVFADALPLNKIRIIITGPCSFVGVPRCRAPGTLGKSRMNGIVARSRRIQLYCCAIGAN